MSLIAFEARPELMHIIDKKGIDIDNISLAHLKHGQVSEEACDHLGHDLIFLL